MKKYNINNLLKEAAVAYEATSSMSLVDLARKGITKRLLLNLADIGELSVKEFAKLLPISLRTLQRYQEDDLLSPEVSEHTLLIAEVFARGLEVFDTQGQFRSWLKTPSQGLGSLTPLSLLDTSFGTRMVTDELGRLEHGVYA